MPRRRGFSLIEMVMVVVIIALVGAIAIPRLSRGSAAAADSAMTANLLAMNKAIELYAAEHGGQFPDLPRVAAQLTRYTDENGDPSATLDASHIYGPYLLKIPPQPKGPRKGQTGIATSDGPTIGWIYDATTGTVYPNPISMHVAPQPNPLDPPVMEQ